MTTKITSKQVKVINDVSFNNNKITNAKIDASENEITGVSTELYAGNNISIDGATISAIVPTKVSELDNDSQYITNVVDDLVNYTTTANLSSVALSGDYNDLINKPIIDSELSDSSTNAVENRVINNEFSRIESLTATNASNILLETSNRQTADNNLQQQIDAITAASDVTDIVGTYQDLQNYDTQHLKDNDIIKVLQDSTHNNASSYYRWNDTTEQFGYVGSEGSYYTKSESDEIFVPQTILINGIGLSNNITLTKNDIGLGNVDNTSDMNKPISTATQNALNSKQDKFQEFTITQDIYNEYKNEYNYVDLKQIIEDYNINGIINLNTFNYFLNDFTIVEKEYVFKNGNIVFDETGNNDGCNIAITANSSIIKFIDCFIEGNYIKNESPETSLISLNNSFLHFENGKIELRFINEKTFIETNNTEWSSVYFNNINIKLEANEDYQYETGDNNFSIIGIKVNNNDLEINLLNTIGEIGNHVADSSAEIDNRFILTGTNIETNINITNSTIKMYGEGEGKKSLDINLDNTNIDIINSTIDGDVYVRRESEKIIQKNKEYNVNDEFYWNGIIINKWTDYNDIIDSITINENTFSQAVNNENGYYEFNYDGTNWKLFNDETINLVDYGISYTLQSGQQLIEGCNIKVELNINAVLGYKVIQTFTTSSSEIDFAYILQLQNENKIEEIGIRAINNFVNSTIVNNVDPEQFFFNEKKGTASFQRLNVNEIYTNRIEVMTEDYWLPIQDENLQSNNVRDAIKELAIRDNNVSSSNLYDIKQLTQAITDKGWACLSHINRKNLSKNDIPTIYADIKDKYDNADEVTSQVIESRTLSGTGDSKGIFYNSKLNKYIIVSENVYYCDSLDSSATLTQVGNITAGQYDNNYNSYCGENILLVPDLGSGYMYKIDLSDWSLKATSIQVSSTNYYRTYITQDDNIYIQSNGNVYRIKDDYNDDTIEQLDTNGDVVTFAWSQHNNKWVVSKTDGIYLTDDFDSYTQIKNVSSNVILCYDNKIFYVVNNGGDDVSIVYSNDLFNTENSISFTYLSRVKYWYCIDERAYFFTWYDSSQYSYIFDMNNISISQNNDITGGIKYANYIPQTKTYVFIKDTNSKLYYATLIKLIETDKYVVNGNDVEIDYYKNGSYKICISDNGTIDANLETIYNYFGYYNYFILNITSEELSLPRNSNLWTYMYVGDDYQDNNLPMGNCLENLKVLMGSNAPTTSTEGKVGNIYIDTNNQKIYVCININNQNYSWVQLSTN